MHLINLNYFQFTKNWKKNIKDDNDNDEQNNIDFENSEDEGQFCL